ncbi:hypothetical protein GE09DRAFT_1058906 [Coniochaeta sp. 2T2.1]|nr:hypothetical protein GE09DRAFT_1058906 [Coniochaeta sp. 2T2.1]
MDAPRVSCRGAYPVFIDAESVNRLQNLQSDLAEENLRLREKLAKYEAALEVSQERYDDLRNQKTSPFPTVEQSVRQNEDAARIKYREDTIAALIGEVKNHKDREARLNKEISYLHEDVGDLLEQVQAHQKRDHASAQEIWRLRQDLELAKAECAISKGESKTATETVKTVMDVISQDVFGLLQATDAEMTNPFDCPTLLKLLNNTNKNLAVAQAVPAALLSTILRKLADCGNSRYRDGHGQHPFAMAVTLALVQSMSFLRGRFEIQTLKTAELEMRDLLHRAWSSFGDCIKLVQGVCHADVQSFVDYHQQRYPGHVFKDRTLPNYRSISMDSSRFSFGSQQSHSAPENMNIKRLEEQLADTTLEAMDYAEINLTLRAFLIKKHEETHAALERKLCNCGRALDTDQSTIARLRQQIKAHERNQSNAQDQIDRQQARIQALESGVASLKKRVLRRDETITEQKRSLVALSAITAQLTDGEQTRHTTMRNVSQLQAQVESLEQVIIQRDETIGEQKESLAAVIAQLDKYERRRHTIKQNVFQLQTHVEDLEKLVIQRNKTIAEQKETLTTLMK